MLQTSLAGQAGIITGGSRGIGAATAVELARLGARLAISGRTESDGAETAAQIRAAGGECLFVPADVRSYADQERLCAACLDAFGRLDFVVANAGVGDDGSLAAGDPARWRTVIETNVLGVAYTVRATLPTLQRQGSGHIVLIASIAGRETYAGEPIYLASKWAVVGMGHALRKEAFRSGVRVTLVEPGLTETPFTLGIPQLAEWMAQIEPLRSEDVAAAVAYALLQPSHVAVSEIVLRPMKQEI
jgi:NADP-dependent 3-hydroxy acid dehydrogenase YdfG